jgi:phosphatidate phosphatase
MNARQEQQRYYNQNPENVSYTSRRTVLAERIMQILTDIIVIIIVFVIFICVYFLVPPKLSYFTCNDSNDINFPYIDDTIVFWAVGIYGVIGPILIIILVELKNVKFFCSRGASAKKEAKHYLVYIFHALSLFVLGISITLCLTEIGKKWVGRLRPHFLSVCAPNYASINCVSPGANGVLYNAIYTGDSFCTGAAKKVQEARLSWPSGHSSFSW